MEENHEMETNDYETRIGKQPIKFASIMTDAKMSFINSLNKSISKVLNQNKNMDSNTLHLIQRIIGVMMSEFDSFFDKLVIQMITVFQNNSNEMLDEIKHLQNKVKVYESAIAQNKTENVIYLKQRIEEKNKIMREYLTEIDHFKVLALIEKAKRIKTTELRKKIKISAQKLGKILKLLQSNDYILVNKDKKPHTIIFKKAPWSDIQ